MYVYWCDNILNFMYVYERVYDRVYVCIYVYKGAILQCMNTYLNIDQLNINEA